jgi:hypothetical protein
MRRRRKGSSRAARPSRPSRGGRASVVYTAAVLVLVGAIAFIALTYYGLFESGASREAPVTVLVLNGCGAEGLGLEATKLLRSNGFDVVDFRNAGRFDYTESIVIDRAGDTGVALDIARLIGTNNVIQQIPATPLVDVVLIIGTDHARYLGAGSDDGPGA